MNEKQFRGRTPIHKHTASSIARLFLVLILITTLTGLASAETQVDNTSNSLDFIMAHSATNKFAVSFTTGNDTYTLNSATTRISNYFGDEIGHTNYSLYSDSAGEPGSLIEFMGPTGDIPIGINSLLYTVTSPGGATLEPNTTYWIVGQGVLSRNMDAMGTADGSETSSSGWTIGDSAVQSSSGSPWFVNGSGTAILSIDASGPYVGENLIAVYSDETIGINPDADGAENTLETITEPQTDVRAYFFLTKPTEIGLFDPSTGLSYLEFRITVTGITENCTFYTAPTVQTQAISGGVIDVDFPLSPLLTPHVDHGNHILLGYMACTVPLFTTVVELKVGPTPNPSTTGPLVEDSESNDFVCGTSVGGNEVVGYDTVIFTMNPDGATPVHNKSATWSQVKALYH